MLMKMNKAISVLSLSFGRDQCSIYLWPQLGGSTTMGCVGSSVACRRAAWSSVPSAAATRGEVWDTPAHSDNPPQQSAIVPP
jgi:hypothetical protein